MAIVKCPDCGREVSDRAAACPGCGYPIAAGSPEAGIPAAIMQLPAQEMLDSVIAEYAARDYRLITRTPTSAQLVKPKRFSFGWAVFWLLMLGFGLLVYLFYYVSRTDEQVFLRVDGESIVAREQGRPERVVRGKAIAKRDSALLDGPGYGASRGRVAAGTSVAVLSLQRDWLRIRTEDGREGWWLD